MLITGNGNLGILRKSRFDLFLLCLYRGEVLQGAARKRKKKLKKIQKEEENTRLVIGHEQKQLRLTSLLLRKWRRIRQKTGLIPAG